MLIVSEGDAPGVPAGSLYDPAMAKTERVNVEKTRQTLGHRLDMGEKDGVHTIVAKHGRDAGVLVPMDWYRQAREALGDPTDL